MRHSRIIPVALAALLAAAFAAPLRAAKIRVVATLAELGAVAEFIGGEHVEVETLARGTEDPHFIDARPSFVRTLNRADILIEGGAEVESGWLPPLVQNARNSKIQPGKPGRVLASAGMELLDVPVALDRSQGDVHQFGNPHYMLDPLLAGKAAQTIAAALAAVDPPHSADYLAKGKQFNAAIESKVPVWEKQLSGCKGTKVVTYHKSFDYLLKRFGLELSGTIEPKPGIEPSPSHVAHLIQRAKAGGVRLILAESFRPHRTGERIASEIGAAYVPLPLTVDGTPEAKDYFSWMDQVVAKIAGACKGSE